ncbi:MAG: hypothetical protein JWM31_2415 [Solirubrobacterales bacterium]|nr:hypothetical protein [Solirubrobacterales bacterium]
MMGGHMKPSGKLFALVVLLVGAALAFLRLRPHTAVIKGAVVHDPSDDTGVDEHGAVHSIQSADIDLPDDAFGELWNPAMLERLARTYWSFLSRCTFGLIRVEYRDDGRDVVLLRRPLVLLSFKPPEYEMNAERGIVRWPIDTGLLVASNGRGKDGYLEIDVRRRPGAEAGMERVNVEVEVASFYPQIAHVLSRWVYTNTQSRIHVLVTYGFLRRLVSRDLEESVTGRWNHPDTVDDTPEPEKARDKGTALA